MSHRQAFSICDLDLCHQVHIGDLSLFFYTIIYTVIYNYCAKYLNILGQ